MRAILLLLLAASAFGCSRVGSITQPAAPDASEPYTFGTGTACQPKVVMFFYNNRTADGGAAGAAFGFGAAASTSQRWAGFGLSADAAATSNTDRAISTTRAIVIINASQAIVASADLVSLDADGFTLNWVDADATQRIINYIAIGGADVTNVHVATYTGSGSPQSITAPNFEPNLVILHFTAATTGAGFSQTIGMATATDSWSLSTSARDAEADSITRRTQRTALSLSTLNHLGAVVTECTTAMISTGFTQTCPTQAGQLTPYIAIRGGSYKLGSFNAPTSDGSAAQTGVGFQPKTLLLASFGIATNASVQSHARASWGAGTTSSNRWSMWHGDTDAAATTVTSSYLDRTKIHITKTEAGASPTAQTHADLVSFASDGFTLDWDADATARQILYLAISTSEASGATTAIPRRIIFQ